MRICIFGASGRELDARYYTEAEAVGRLIGENGDSIVFGGGAEGLMGACARGVSAAGGNVVGIAPRFFDEPGILYDKCSRMIFTETMRERKQRMQEESDACIVLPGGIGTMEETFEVITLSSLGRMQKKSAFLDAESYWEPAVELLRGAVEKGFAGRELNEHYARFTDVKACLDYLEK